MTRLLVLPVALGLAALAVGQPAAPPATPYLSGVAVEQSCQYCHQAPSEGAVKLGSDQFVLLREYAYWQGHDLHERAFAALSSKLGQQMSERLFSGDRAGATTAAACLTCHATPGPKGFDGSHGVNCQACHGPAGSTDWLAGHFQQSWREKPPAEKARLGQVNLRDPAVRADKCVSCHVGSAAEGKFVTHAMYAAGHPPLPAFELATFSRDEPRHWRPAKDVEYLTKLPAEVARARFSVRAGEVEAARLAAVGAVTALRETVRLAKSAPPGPLDFAHFNCAACHHELVVPSDRQQNGFPGVAGRPVPTTWPVWAVRAVLRQSTKEQAAGFEAAYERWRQAFDAAPFGDRVKVAAAAGGLEAACAGVLKQLDAARFDEAAARQLVRGLVDEAGSPTGRRDYLDVDAAGVLARAATAIGDELTGSPTLGPMPAVPGAFAEPLHRLVGLGVREASDNRTLLHERGTYATRARRAFDFRVADFRRAFGRLP